jgi:branched-subunit amino acid transport protein
LLWLTVIAVGAVTYVQRAFFMTSGDGRPEDSLLRRGLRFVPASVLVALVVPNLLVVEGQLLFSPTNFRLIAGLVAIAVAWRARSILWTLIAGMAVLFILQWVISFQGG